MHRIFILADMSPLPLLIGGGFVLVLIGGVILALAVAMFGWIRRKRNRSSTPPSDVERTNFPDLE